MDAPNPSATPTFASRTPLHIGAVGLRVRDLDRVTSFYRDVLGLAVLDRGNDATALGAGGVRFVHLEHAPNAEPDDPRSAGLYHTAFLMPTRGDLARWFPARGAPQGAAHGRFRPRGERGVLSRRS